MKKVIFSKTITFLILLLFILATGFVSAQIIYNPHTDDNDFPSTSSKTSSGLFQLFPGIVYVVDCSGSIDSEEMQGMKNAITRAIGRYETAVGLTIGVVCFAENAIISVPPRIIDDISSYYEFLFEIYSMPQASGQSTAMHKGVEKAKGLASHMVVMTDAEPGLYEPAVEACEEARLLGQKISIAHYPGEYPSYTFPFVECTNADGRYPDQPIGYEYRVETPSEMIDTVTGWVRSELARMFKS